MESTLKKMEVRETSDSAFIWDVLILGAGPAGLFAGMSAADFSVKNQRKILILEKMPTPGRKLLAAGSGRCNVTHAGKIQDFFCRYGEKERFVKPALLNFTNQDLMEFLQTNGLPCVELNDGKIFPRTERSRDVLNLFLQACERFRVQIACQEAAVSASWNEKRGVFEIRTENGKAFSARKLIAAVGGKSYPGTGSTGDGTILAHAFGHSLIPLKPALTPVAISRFPFASCAGISLPDAFVSLWRNGKKIATRSGDVLFTHRGLSGPGILDFSRDFLPGDVLKIPFALNENGKILTDELLVSLLQKNPQRELKNLVRTAFQLPERFVSELFQTARIPESLSAWQVTKKIRKTLLQILTDFPFEIQSLGGFREAMVTAGGIALSEVNRQTMESRLVSGLYFAGEVLDVDGDTGGFNLQFAFASGVLAGKSALKELIHAEIQQ